MRADRSAVPAFQSTEPTTTEKALIRRVLLGTGGIWLDIT
jgi:hypothetical protein